MRNALGSASKRLDRRFLERLEAAVRLRDPSFSMDPSAWWAMDFHLDWLVAALHMLRHGEDSAKACHHDRDGHVTGNQRDLDLVVVSGTTLILVEAKGVGAWGDGLTKKVEKIATLPPDVIDESGAAGPVRVHFVLCSPEAPPDRGLEKWPKWMKTNCGQLLHFGLRLEAEAGPLLRVERCGRNGKRSATGGHWHVVDDARGNELIKAMMASPAQS